ncbi:GroES-like protein [Macroventuria anomochaeta]|uniref:GroES-like protein n=1 Tax=Macroventuria anomochaeta TaxID=301207 RepID=A0ACB6S000_9PLEO|nr:GroES-like protein [Macroventuria anomochaeta]KAF2626723.1 GroES-like protein [Macroventuria anomochaeta]
MSMIFLFRCMLLDFVIRICRSCKIKFPASLPMIPSPELADKILQVGAQVHGSWKFGDPVWVLNFKNACRQCIGCQQHMKRSSRTRIDPRFCERRQMVGFKHDSAFADYMLADPETTIHLPEGVSFEQGAPLVCAGATALGALQKLRPDVKSGEAIAIVGVGGIGHLIVQFAKEVGFRAVAIDNREESRQLALDVVDHLKPDLVVDSMASDAEPCRQVFAQVNERQNSHISSTIDFSRTDTPTEVHSHITEKLGRCSYQSFSESSLGDL